LQSKLREQIAAFDKAIRAEVKQSHECRLLMNVPGIGPVTVLAYVSAIERPDRFRRSRLAGAHLGLTPRQYQSGDVDRSGHISKCGDTLARLCLYEAATVIMTRVKRPSGLKIWAMKIAKRSGTNKARVALARKLAVIFGSKRRLSNVHNGLVEVALCGPTASGGVVCTLAPEGKLTDLVLPQQNASPG
jgi:transposase